MIKSIVPRSRKEATDFAVYLRHQEGAAEFFAVPFVGCIVGGGEP